jgi:hypothetical protein
MANTLPGKGTLLKLKVASAFTAILQLVEIDGVDPELKMRDVTHLMSAMVSSRPAITDPGTISGKGFFDPNDAVAGVGHSILRAKIFSPPTTPDEFQLTYADGDTTSAYDDFKGYFTKFKVTGFKVEETVQFEWEIRITDSFAATPGTP